MQQATSALLRALVAFRSSHAPATLHAAATSTIAGRSSHRPWLELAAPLAATCMPKAGHAYTTIPEPQDAYLYDAQLQQPNYTQPISIMQLDNLCRNPTLERLVNSAVFIKQQMPARLDNHIHRLKGLKPKSAPLAELLEESAGIKSDLLEVARDWRFVDTSTPAGLAHFESHLRTFKDGLEAEMERLQHSTRALTQEVPHWWDDEQQVQDLNRTMDLCHWYILSVRVMTTQHLAALHAMQGRPHAKHPGPPGPDHRVESLIVRNAPVRQVLEYAAEDCRALCIEKNSAAPDVLFRGGEGLHATIIEPYVGFVFSEVMKNAMQATIRRFGAWDVDDADPIQVTLAEPQGSTHFTITVTDHANGVPESYGQHVYDYYQSTSSGKRAALAGTWRDSRTHGPTEKGLGVGVPMARVYAHFMGGSAEWQTTYWPQRGCTVVIKLPKLGFTF